MGSSCCRPTGAESSGGSRLDSNPLNLNSEQVDHHENILRRTLFELMSTSRKSFFDAILKGRLDAVVKLVEGGANVNVLDSNERTPLHVAVHCKQPEICKYLVSAGCNVNKKDSIGASPLFRAVQAGCKETAAALIQSGAIVNTHQKIPFHAATARNDVEMMHLLFLNGANPEQKGAAGYTPLHISAQTGCSAAARFLVVGICVTLDATNDLNETPFHVAMSQRHRYVLDLLVMAGCDIRGEECVFQRSPHWMFGTDMELTLTRRYAWFVRNPRSLQDLCTFRIRRHLGRRLPNVVDSLPYPVKVKKILKLAHIPFHV